MSSDLSISCRGLTKKYPLYKNDFQRLKGLVLPHYRPELFTALDSIDLDVKKGEILGIVGLNGSGKSTLSNIIAGITYPTEGYVNVNGDVSMLAVNSGMDNSLTGRENIYFKCTLLGISKKDIARLEAAIIDFADIGIYIDQPIRTYSSGMRARLGFAISVHMDPEILVIDEGLSVGDNSFAEKSLAKMMEFKEKEKTILFVSHSVGQMEDFCDRVMWLNNGKIVGIDEPRLVVAPYCLFAREHRTMNKEEQKNGVPSLTSYQERLSINRS